MSRFEIKMPKLGESITEGTIVSWSVTVSYTHLQSTFQRDVRSRTPHQFDEMPIFAGRVTVTLMLSLIHI